MFLSIFSKKNTEAIIINVSRNDREEYNRRLGTRKKSSSIFSSLKKNFLSIRNDRNKKNLFANARDVTVIKFGIGAKPRNDAVKVIGLVGIFTAPLNKESWASWSAIKGIEMPSDFKDINSDAYVNWSGKRNGEKAK